MKYTKDAIQCKYDGCDYEPFRQSNLDKHIKETHQKSEQNLLQCNICEYKTENLTLTNILNKIIRSQNRNYFNVTYVNIVQ